MEYPNKGTLWYQDNKKNPKAPDFIGSIKFDKYMLLKIIEDSSGPLIEVNLGAWRGKIETKNGSKNVININVSNKQEKKDADEIPF